METIGRVQEGSDCSFLNSRLCEFRLKSGCRHVNQPGAGSFEVVLYILLQAGRTSSPDTSQGSENP